MHIFYLVGRLSAVGEIFADGFVQVIKHLCRRTAAGFRQGGGICQQFGIGYDQALHFFIIGQELCVEPFFDFLDGPVISGFTADQISVV